MFNPKMESRNKKNDKIPPQTLCFFGFIIVVICCSLKYHAAENLLIGGRESFEMAVGLGKCGRECLSGPCNTAFSHAEKAESRHNVNNRLFSSFNKCEKCVS
jgi:hypothetical protein